MEPTVRQLEAFRALAAELHFGSAATALGVAQPTLSKEIKLLERTLRVPLFTRGAGGTRLTPDGRALLPHAEAVLDQVAKLLGAARQLQPAASHRVRVAATPSVVNRLLQRVLRTLEATGPGIEVTVLEVETGGVPAALVAHDAEVGLGHHIPAVDGCERRTIGRDELYVVLNAGLVPSAAAVDLTDLVDLPLLMWPRDHNPRYYDALLATCRDRGLDPLILTGSSRISGARSYLLREGRAFTLVPRDYALTEPPPLVALPLTRPATVPLDAVWRTPPTAAATAFLRATRSCVPRRQATHPRAASS